MALQPPPMAVAEVIAAHPPAVRKKMQQLRRIVLTTARRLGIGEIVETLRWSEPTYVPKAARVGTAIRIGTKKTDPTSVRLYVHCQTSLVQTYRTLFPELEYEGNRGVLFKLDQPLPENEIRLMVEAAMTYHQRREQRTRQRTIKNSN